jgi:hypothetical protein
MLDPHIFPDSPVASFIILANAILFTAQALPVDEIVIGMAPGLLPGEVELEFWACDSTVTIFRSTDPATVTDMGNEIGQTAMSTWLDMPPAGDLFHYRILKP